jgi:hypothetical protein
VATTPVKRITAVSSAHRPVKQTQKGSLQDQVMGNEGVAGTVVKQL